MASRNPFQPVWFLLCQYPHESCNMMQPQQSFRNYKTKYYNHNSFLDESRPYRVLFYCIVLLDSLKYFICFYSKRVIWAEQQLPDRMCGTSSQANIYTIIFLNSVCLSVSRRSQTAGRNSCSIVSGNASNCSHRLTVYPVTSSRLNSA